MNILYYARDGAADGIQEAIGSLPLGVEVYRNVADLMNRLRHPLEAPAIAVLVADSRECLEVLHALRHLFRHVRIIAVLPDMEPGTVSMGHDMHARFLTCIDDDPVEVGHVLKKMVETQQRCSAGMA